MRKAGGTLLFKPQGGDKGKSGPNTLSSERTEGRPLLSFHDEVRECQAGGPLLPGQVPFPGFVNRGVKARVSLRLEEEAQGAQD